jgi:tetratricopeptide (TPR) repeat protein
MTFIRPNLIKLLAPLLAFGATLAVIVSINRSSNSPPTVGAGDASSFAGAAGSSTDAQIRALQSALATEPKNPNGLASLGNAYLQKARETADSSFYSRAEVAFERALNQDPRNAGALTGMGSLALSRHDFRGGLRYGERALAAAPGVARIYGVIVDAQVELGRYADAERSLQRMVDLKPGLSSYARVSYFRELHGDLNGAVQAMRLAVSAGGGAPENVAYVQTLLGTLLFDRGELAPAEHAYRTALASFPRYAPATAGLARVDAARGNLGSTIRRYRAVVARVPLPEYVIALGEAELAADRTSAARSDLDLVRVEEGLLARNGVNTDVDLALFEANHGDPAKGVALARRAWAAAPSVRSADALGWALTRAGRADDGLAWAKRALRLGSKDPMFLYHAGISARAAGRDDVARTYLERSLALNPRFSPLYAPRAKRALAQLR